LSAETKATGTRALPQGPFQVIWIEQDVHQHGKGSSGGSCSAQLTPHTAPLRRYDCDNYQCCLELAAALDWESFTCLGCSGELNDKLFRQAHMAQRGE